MKPEKSEDALHCISTYTSLYHNERPLNSTLTHAHHPCKGLSQSVNSVGSNMYSTKLLYMEREPKV